MSCRSVSHHTNHWEEKRLVCLQTTLHNCRGAAFLLSVYVAALMLLLLGGVSLQRTTIDVQASRVSRDLQQSFQLAEAGMDRALSSLRQGKTLTAQGDDYVPDDWRQQAAYEQFYASRTELADGIYGPYYPNPTDTSRGYVFRVKTTKIEVLGPDGMRVTREITATGTSQGRPTTVAATVVSDAVPLSGFFSNGPAILSSVGMKGSIHTASGVPGSIWIGDNVVQAHVFGDVTIGLPDPVNPYKTLLGKFDWVNGSEPDMDVGPPYWIPASKPGVMIASYGWRTSEPKDLVAGTIGVVDLPKIQPIAFGEPAGPPPVPLVIPSGQSRTIVDNSADDLDLRPGKIALGVASLSLGGESALLFTSPFPEPPKVKIFVFPKANDSHIVRLNPKSVLVALDKDSRTVPDGVQLLVSKFSPNPRKGNVTLYQPRAFYGSIWAPESQVSSEDNQWWMGFRDGEGLEVYQKYLQDPGAPGGLQGSQFGYVVSNQLVGGGSCTSLLAEQMRPSDVAANGFSNLLGWHNTLEHLPSQPSPQE